MNKHGESIKIVQTTMTSVYLGDVTTTRAHRNTCCDFFSLRWVTESTFSIPGKPERPEWRTNVDSFRISFCKGNSELKNIIWS